jgi:hypothetical protein
VRVNDQPFPTICATTWARAAAGEDRVRTRTELFASNQRSSARGDAPSSATTGSNCREIGPGARPVCCRRYWKHNLKTVRRLGTKHGGVYADGIHFRYQGGQARSLLSLLSYLGSGEYRDRYLGIKIPPTSLQEHHLAEARKFADGLANRINTAEPSSH